MNHSFDQAYWDSHWEHAPETTGTDRMPPHPSLESEISGLQPGSALDAGSGEGAEAIWLAQRGWRVTAADISSEALRRASAQAGPLSQDITWRQADLITWNPDQQFDLVTTFYAHPSMPQLAFYKRIAEWVKPGGTLLIVGHLHTHRHEHPSEASVTAARITATLDPAQWHIETAAEIDRTIHDGTGRPARLSDVITRATRLSSLADQERPLQTGERSR